LEKFSQRTKLVCSLVGVALAVPLLVAPASAALDGGHFYIHAQDFDSPKPHEATAGLGGFKADEGSEGTAPAVTLADYSFGPMKLTVTDAMVNFDKDNRAASSPTTTADGWQGLYNFNSATSPNVVPGWPTDGSKPSQFYLTSGLTTPNRTAAYPEGVIAYAKSYDTSYTAMDSRNPSAGKAFYYYWSKAFSSTSTDSFTEGRYEQIDGSLAATRVGTQSGGVSVNRYESANSGKPALSDSYPSTVSVSTDGNRTAVMTFKKTIDGYNYANYRKNADGSGNISYSYWNGAMSSYGTITGVGAPSRTNGPTAVQWDSSGNIVGLSSPGKTITAPFTADHYNEITGQNWDGSYLKPADVKLDAPFEPTKATR